MIGFAQLLLPWLVSAVLVFIASSLIHMVFKWHNSDYLQLANEEEVRAAIRKASAKPGQYVIPYCADIKDLQSPEMQHKFIEGPVAFLLMRASGAPKMGPSLLQWFGLNLFVAAIVAHIAWATLSASSNRHLVFHTAALMTFLAYATGSLSGGIWKAHPWKSVAKEVLDALIFGIVSGMAYAWLWPVVK